MHGYASLSRRLTAIKVVFALVTVVALAAIVSDLLELAMMDRALAGSGLTGAEFDANERRQNVVGGVQFVLFIVAAVTFLTWLTRAYRNLDAIGPNERRFGHGWLVGAWFVPIFNLWRPKQYVDDVWRAGRPHASMLLPGIWWALFLLANWFDVFVRVVAFDRDTAEGYRDGTYALLLSDLLDVIAAPLAIALTIVATQRLNTRAAQAREATTRFTASPAAEMLRAL
jgi:hypothetical protein